MTQAFNLSQFANKINTSGQASLTTAVTGTLPIANGGTGLATVGTDGQVLQSNGSTLVYATPAAGGFSNMQVFTSSGTFTVPAGVTKAKVTVVGGGGSGGTASNDGQAAATVRGAPGGGGGCAMEVVGGLTPFGTVSVTVGGANGTSSFGAFCSATGGANGANATRTSANPAGGAGGAGSGGQLNINGNDGFANSAISSSIGGSSQMSAQRLQNQTGAGPTTGLAGFSYGGGATGGYRNSAVAGTTAGGTGASGVVIVEY
jgi:hypothetical protein